MASASLLQNEYGKRMIRVVRVIKHENGNHEIRDLRVRVLLKGKGLDVSYTNEDNSAVVPTDTIKNTVFALARTESLRCVEEFALAVVRHFLDMYKHITHASVDVEQFSWDRMNVNGFGHQHSFVPNPAIRTARAALVRGGQPTLASGVKNVVLMKTTGSGFVGYHKCKFTSLPAMTDRILKTTAEMEWTYLPGAAPIDYDDVFAKVLADTYRVFATKYSPSVQATQFDIANAVFASCPQVSTISSVMPNQHNWIYDLERFGIENKGEVYMPTQDPEGYITSTFGRNQKSKI